VIESDAVAVPEFVSIELPVTPALPQVLPTSVNAIAAAEPARLGTTSTIWSFTAIDTWGMNANDTADAEPPTLVAKVSEVFVGDGIVTDVEFIMLVAGMSALAASVTAAVRVAKFAGCSTLGAVMPE
jgi:hypothetical protein